VAGVAIVFALAWILRDPLRHLMPARLPGWSPLSGKECTDEVVPHVLAGISFAFFLAVYVSAGIRRRGIATPATAICALLGLITAVYGVLAFHHAPMTAVVILLALFALVYGLVRKRPRDAVIAGALVVSHWFLDWIVHRPDLPLYPGDQTRHGLDLWDSFAGSLSVELALFVAGIILFLRSTRARAPFGAIGFWVLVVLLALGYLAAVFGPPPPSTNAVAGSVIVLWLFFAFAWWFDRHREPTHA